jgi:hypothetical protein
MLYGRAQLVRCDQDPTPINSARNLHNHYAYKATEMSTKALEYEKKSSAQPPSGNI